MELFLVKILSCFILFVSIGRATVASDIYAFNVKDIKGKEVSMAKYKGKVLLIVNVATECGFTDTHYKQLVQLKNRLIIHDFEILAFPCNQFGQQEPYKNSAIERFAKNKYGVNFPMFSKVKVFGELAHPLYQYLADQIGRKPQWNFAKYLVDAEGMVVRFWSQEVTPMSLVSDIQMVIAPGLEEEFVTGDVRQEL